MRSALLLLLLGPALRAQPADKLPAFEVASVKVAQPVVVTAGPDFYKRVANTGGPGTDDPGRIHYPYATPRTLLSKAFHVEDYQVSGPAWLDSEHYQIDATMAPGTPMEQFRLMLQRLLAERFGLAVHHESREIQAYVLVIAKGGPKMKEVPPDDDPKNFSGVTGGWAMKGHVTQDGHAATMHDLAERFSIMLQRPVSDDTGLTAKYDFKLDYSTEGIAIYKGMRAPPPDAEPFPTIFTALPAQIGIRLETKKAPVDTIVVDHMEKTPTEN